METVVGKSVSIIRGHGGAMVERVWDEERKILESFLSDACVNDPEFIKNMLDVYDKQN